MANNKEEREFDTRAAAERKATVMRRVEEAESLIEEAAQILRKDVIAYYRNETPASETEERRMHEGMQKYIRFAKRGVERAARLIDEIL